MVRMIYRKRVQRLATRNSAAGAVTAVTGTRRKLQVRFYVENRYSARHHRDFMNDAAGAVTTAAAAAAGRYSVWSEARPRVVVASLSLARLSIPYLDIWHNTHR